MIERKDVDNSLTKFPLRSMHVLKERIFKGSDTRNLLKISCETLVASPRRKLLFLFLKKEEEKLLNIFDEGIKNLNLHNVGQEHS